MNPYDPSQQLHGLDQSSPQLHEQFRDFPRGGVYHDALPNLQSENLTSLVEYLDRVLVGISDRAIPIFQESLCELSKICGLKEVLPKSWALSESRLGCVYKGTFNGSKVRIRRVKMHPGGDTRKVKEAFHKVAVISKRSAHPNIVPLLGVAMEPLELISDWMSGGDLTRYIAKHPHTNKVSLLSDVAEGLSYLHSCDVIHGDLKGSNILVDATNRARIADFGLAMVTRDPSSMRSASADNDQSTRWIAPEIFGGGTYSKEADIFSFAGVVIEAFTGAVPFSDKSFDEAKSAVERGERPPRPIHPTLTDDIWRLIQRCWNKDACLRPHALRISCAFSGVPAWKCLIDRHLVLGERISLIRDIFSNHDDTKAVADLPEDDAQSFVDVVDKTLDSIESPYRQALLKTLCKEWGHRAPLPSSLQIQLLYDWSSGPHYHGGCAEVWKVEYQGDMVAAKVLKVSQSNDIDEIRRSFFKEVMVWKNLHHPNVLQLLGATINDRRFEMVSKWMDNGNINEFVKKHGSENRFKLLKDVTSGLIYLHNQPVIHGDLKGANILIDRNCHALLADFGLLTFARDPANPTTSTSTAGVCGTIRWMSPELLNPERFGLKDSRPTKESDCYALGMVILEVLSGRPPFALSQNPAVMWKVMNYEFPERPKEVQSADLWGLLEQCWSFQPKERPTPEVILECLERVSPNTSIDRHEQVHAADGATSKPYHRPQATPPSPLVEPNALPTSGGRSTVTNDWIETLLRLDGSSSQFPNQLSNILSRREFDEFVQTLEEKDVVAIIEHLDMTLDNLSPAGSAFERTHRRLQRICVSRRLLPSSHTLSGGTLNLNELPFASGFSDVHKGEYTDLEYNDLQVCVKKLRVACASDLEKPTKMLFREALMWKRLMHPNIVPFVGVTADPPQIVSKWMPGGNLTTYIKLNPHRDRVSLLVDVAKGLDYIHSHGVIHGDLKGPNILVDIFGRARITDFGLAQDALGVVSIPERRSERWTAPEVLAETGTPSMEADVFSFGMVMVEAFTGTAPFSNHIPLAAMMAIISGRRPPRPEHSGLTDGLWDLINLCWEQDQYNRPRMLEVLLTLNPLLHELSDIQQQLGNLDSSDEEYRPLLYAFLSHSDLKPHIDSLPKDDLQEFVELLDKALHYIPTTDGLFRKALRRLQSTCSNHEVLPRSYLILGGRLLDRKTSPAAEADAHEAQFNGKRVCIKALRSNAQRKTFYGGVIVWKKLQHPNIVPLLGIPAEIQPLETVSEWMEHGGITEYVRKHPEVDRIGLLWDVAEGLHYLHSHSIVHGNLKGIMTSTNPKANVLIDENGHARLTDLGLASTVLGNRSVVGLLETNRTTGTRWAAPEISKGGSVTKAGEVFTFAMVAFEAFTEHSLSIKGYAAVLNGGLPERPVTLSDDLWDLMQNCWNQNPGERPTSFGLVEFFRPSFLKEQEISETQTPSSGGGENTGSRSDPSDGGARKSGNWFKVLGSPRSPSPKPPPQRWFGGRKRADTATEHEPSTQAPKPAVHSASWAGKLRSPAGW